MNDGVLRHSKIQWFMKSQPDVIDICSFIYIERKQKQTNFNINKATT